MKRILLTLVLVLTAGASAAIAQPSASAASASPASGAVSDEALKVFLDCKANTPCFSDYVKTEISYVDYVNVREAANVHVLVTSLGNGAGGREFTLKFVGLGEFRGVEDEVLFSTLPTDTEDLMRREFVRTLKLGLVRYALHTRAATELQITRQAPRGPARPAGDSRAARDPWNHWVMRARVNGSYDSESTSNSTSSTVFASANRTTAAWKLGLSTYRASSESNYTFSDGTTYNSTRKSHDVTAQAVRAVAGHVSAGGKAYVAANTYENKDRVLNATGAVEYNFFPYSEGTRRQLTLQYYVGLTNFRYIEETVYAKMAETVGNHGARAAFDMKQTWGSLSATFDYWVYMHNREFNRKTLAFDGDIRLFKGFALSLSARTSSIHDQLYLPKGEASDEEVLARQRQLATSFRRSLRVGVSYTFGSIFSSVVNTRLSNFVGG